MGSRTVKCRFLNRTLLLNTLTPSNCGNQHKTCKRYIQLEFCVDKGWILEAYPQVEELFDTVVVRATSFVDTTASRLLTLRVLPYTHPHKGSTNWTQWCTNNDKKKKT